MNQTFVEKLSYYAMKSRTALLALYVGGNFLIVRYAAAADCTTSASSATVCNPTGITDIKALIVTVLTYIIGLIAVGAVTAIVVAGARMIASGGNEEAIKKAKGMLTGAIIGLVVAVLAYSIVAIVKNALITPAAG